MLVFSTGLSQLEQQGTLTSAISNDGYWIIQQIVRGKLALLYI